MASPRYAPVLDRLKKNLGSLSHNEQTAAIAELSRMLDIDQKALATRLMHTKLNEFNDIPENMNQNDGVIEIKDSKGHILGAMGTKNDMQTFLDRNSTELKGLVDERCMEYLDSIASGHVPEIEHGKPMMGNGFNVILPDSRQIKMNPPKAAFGPVGNDIPSSRSRRKREDIVVLDSHPLDYEQGIDEKAGACGIAEKENIPDVSVSHEPKKRTRKQIVDSSLHFDMPESIEYNKFLDINTPKQKPKEHKKYDIKPGSSIKSETKMRILYYSSLGRGNIEQSKIRKFEENFGTTSTQVSLISNQLEGSGYLERKIDTSAKQGEQISISITEKGRKELENIEFDEGFAEQARDYLLDSSLDFDMPKGIKYKKFLDIDIPRQKAKKQVKGGEVGNTGLRSDNSRRLLYYSSLGEMNMSQVREVEKLLGMPQIDLSIYSSALEKSGYITKTKNPEKKYGEQLSIKITKKGRQELKNIELSQGFVNEVNQHLSEIRKTEPNSAPKDRLAIYSLANMNVSEIIELDKRIGFGFSNVYAYLNNLDGKVLTKQKNDGARPGKRVSALPHEKGLEYLRNHEIDGSFIELLEGERPDIVEKYRMVLKGADISQL